METITLNEALDILQSEYPGRHVAVYVQTDKIDGTLWRVYRGSLNNDESYESSDFMPTLKTAMQNLRDKINQPIIVHQDVSMEVEL